MPRILLALPVLLVPAAAPAQQGPSFDCGYASTRTEIAICANPELARLERQMVDSYNALVDVIGQGEARPIADDLLAERQACQGDVSCIADQLLVSMEVFNRRSGRGGMADTVTARTGTPGTLTGGAGVSPFDQAQLQDLIQRARESRDRSEIAAAEPPVSAAAPPPVAAAAPPAATQPNPDIPLAAQAPLPADATPDLSGALDSAELASSDGAATLAAPTGDPDAQAAFDTPLSWAFMDLEREERIGLQERLAGAGFLEGRTQGTWTNATLAALQRLVEEEGSGSFDVSTQPGAALLLDYISSDAFTTAFGGADTASATPAAATALPSTPPTVVDTGDPLAGTDW